MLKDLEPYSITVFRLGKKEQFDPRERVIEFDMVDDHQPMYVSATEPTPIQIHRQRVEIKTIGLDGIHYKYALAPELQELVDELMELETRQLREDLHNARFNYRKFKLLNARTCHDRFVDWAEAKLLKLRIWYATR